MWDLLCYRESNKPWFAITFFKAKFEIMDDTIVTLLPINLRYRAFVEELRSSLLRRGFDVETITSDSLFRVQGIVTLIREEEDFIGVFELFKKNFGLTRTRIIQTNRRRDVWIFARPTSHALKITSVAGGSQRRFHLCHWGVLVTELSMGNFNRLTRAEESLFSQIIRLGEMFELFQNTEGLNTLCVTNPFLTTHLLRDWPMVAFRYNTSKSRGEIENEGTGLCLRLLFIPLNKPHSTQLALDSILKQHLI